MKSYTDLEQSRKLAEILPLESADMARCGGENVIMTNYISAKKKFSMCGEITITPCWSLAALLNAVKYNTINLHYNDERNDWVVSCTMEHSTRYESGRALNQVDACYEMILKLKEQNLL